MRRFLYPLILIAVSCWPTSISAGLVINLNDIGGTAPTTTGTGSLYSVMRAASDVWELAYNGTEFNHTLDLAFRWTAKSGSTLANHVLFGQTGGRETSGLINFDNDGSSAFFLDGTLDTTNLAALIASSSEFSTYNESSSNLGGGLLNVQRTFSGATGAAAGRIDAFSIALHEIGHALGMDTDNLSYQAESWPDNDVDVTGLLPFAGTVIPTNNSAVPADFGTSNPHMHTSLSTTLLYSNFSSGTRKLPSAVDILANAQLSQFTDPNYELASAATGVPEPSAMLLASIVGGMGIAFRFRRRRVANGIDPANKA